MHVWKLKEAASHLDEVVKKAAAEGPQQIAASRKISVVIVTQEQWNRLCQRKPSLVDIMRNSPLVDMDLNLTRDPSPGRLVEL
ncbi:MAG: type II toxin-antitoxin system prevent-host-death family antitoxin [Myxococcota bacterium]